MDTQVRESEINAVIASRELRLEPEIIEFCQRKTADFKVPSIVEFRTELPKSSTGKLLRKNL